MGGLMVYRRRPGSFPPEVVNLLANLCDPVGLGDSKRPAVPGDRG